MARKKVQMDEIPVIEKDADRFVITRNGDLLAGSRFSGKQSTGGSNLFRGSRWNWGGFRQGRHLSPEMRVNLGHIPYRRRIWHPPYLYPPYPVGWGLGWAIALKHQHEVIYEREGEYRAVSYKSGANAIFGILGTLCVIFLFLNFVILPISPLVEIIEFGGVFELDLIAFGTLELILLILGIIFLSLKSETQTRELTPQEFANLQAKENPFN